MKTEANKKQVPPFDEIVFASRNREYGAYVLRKDYKRNVVISLMIAVAILSATVIIPFLNAKATTDTGKRSSHDVEIIMEDIQQPVEQVVTPPPPPPADEALPQTKYTPPVVVDSVPPDDLQLMTADEAIEQVHNEDVVDIPVVVQEEVQEEEPVEVPFIVVEEMPSFPGGDAALLAYIRKNTIYPPIAQENNMQGMVVVRFCVTAKGGVSQVSILRSVDPELDKEAMRVVNTLPPFNPGKQGGKAVPVWFSVPITFKLNQ